MKNKNTVFASIPTYEGAAVYSITDNNGRQYIGSSGNLQKRITEWNSNFKTMKATGKPAFGCTQQLADAICAGKVFSISVVRELGCECSRDDRRKAEQEVIEECGGIENTYNFVNAVAPDGMTEQRKNYLLKYAKEHVRRIPLNVSHDKYDEIKAHAVRCGKSVNGYIKDVVDEAMAREDEALDNG